MQAECATQTTLRTYQTTKCHALIKHNLRVYIYWWVKFLDIPIERNIQTPDGRFPLYFSEFHIATCQP